MHIAIDGRAAIWYRGTGIGTYTSQLIHELCLLNNHQYSILLPENQITSTCPDFSSLEASHGYFWEYLHDQPPTNNLLQDQPHLWHIPHNGIEWQKLKPQLHPDTKLVVTIHDLIPYVYPETVGKYYLEAFLRQMPEILADAQAIIAVSQNTKNDLIKLAQVPAEKITVIPEAPEQIYKPLDKQMAKSYISHVYGINSPFILYLGGFGPRKNLAGLLEGFARAQNQLPPDTKLVCLGRPSPHSPQILQLVKKMNLTAKVLFPGFIPLIELPIFYNAACCFAYLSLYEGFGLPPLEALACGTPTLCSNTSSLPEVIGNGGLLVDPTNLTAISESLSIICNDPITQERLSQAGLMQAGKFSWQTTAIATSEVYRKA